MLHWLKRDSPPLDYWQKNATNQRDRGALLQLRARFCAGEASHHRQCVAGCFQQRLRNCAQSLPLGGADYG